MEARRSPSLSSGPRGCEKWKRKQPHLGREQGSGVLGGSQVSRQEVQTRHWGNGVFMTGPEFPVLRGGCP